MAQVLTGVAAGAWIYFTFLPLRLAHDIIQSVLDEAAHINRT